MLYAPKQEANEEVESERPPMDYGDVKCQSEERSVDSNDCSPTKGVSTRAARRAKNQKSVENGINIEELIELQEAPTRTALTNSSKHQARIQVGENHQAPPVEQLDPSQAHLDEDRDIQIWENCPEVSDEMLDEYVDEAAGVYGMAADRALYILQRVDYHMPTARMEVESRKAVKDEWNNDDKILFRMAFKEYGKNFDKIRQVIPYRSMRSVVQYYYLVKKRWKDKDHVHDLRDVAMLEPILIEDALPVRGSDPRGRKKKSPFIECENEAPLLASLMKHFIEDVCCHCGTASHAIRVVEMEQEFILEEPKEEEEKKLCLRCSLYYEYTGTLPEMGEIPLRGDNDGDIYKCPEGFMDMIKEFSEMATYVSNNPSAAATNPDIEKTRAVIETKELRAKVNEQIAKILRMEEKLEAEFNDIPDVEDDRYRTKINKGRERQGRKREEWSDKEKYFATNAFMRYGLDFEAVTEVVASKTVTQVKKFYADNKKTIDKHNDKMEKVRKQLVEVKVTKEEKEVEERQEGGEGRDRRG